MGLYRTGLDVVERTVGQAAEESMKRNMADAVKRFLRSMRGGTRGRGTEVKPPVEASGETVTDETREAPHRKKKVRIVVPVALRF